MKKFLLTLFSLLFVSTLSFAQRSSITKFEGKPIKGVIVSGAFDVNISLGNNPKASVDFPDGSSNKLTFELTDDNYIRLSYGKNASSLFVSQKNRPRATIVLTQLDYINLSGDAMLIGSGTFESEKLVMNVSGTAFASFVMVDCQESAIIVSGAARIEDVKINATKDMTIEVGGSSKATIAGSAPQIKVVASAASALNLLSFKSPQIEAVTSGTAVIKADVTGKATVITSGVSAFRYTGNGIVSGDGAKRL